ncbi:MAG: hydantoinase/oxoprolinase family protein [Dehalococcoidia bacterium]|nr:hydantoinase/oxoprolinase family protein [Dehalococcoidia bacterium]MYI85467.1 hydantoinase/oxoprolinase family protein [Dehalococcoidia bacterium]
MTGAQDGVLGVDVGGTFTDFVAIDGSGIRTWKRLSTPSAPERAVLEGADGLAEGALAHGSTVATNALLERRGPRTILVTTEGFHDLLTIRRQERPALYDLEPRRTPHVVSRGDVITVRERIGASGEVVVPLDDAEVARVVDDARRLHAEAVAICLLFSYLRPEHEALLAGALREAGFPVSASHEVLPEHREYERASTTAVNAFLQPTVRGYLGGIDERSRGLRVMHSAGGLTDAATASERPVSMVTSGPAGGVLGALAVARSAGHEQVITFDMGGTSTDVSLCPGEPRYRSATEVDGLAVHTPMVDIVTVGAGGGSIARLDSGGALAVGPQSAGADPGPACYGRGTLPTVSDANLVLGRLRPEAPLGGSVIPDLGRAREALATLGETEAAASSVVEVANATMARALRRVSLERGYDPAGFTLVAFGGAGPLHACELAAELGIGKVLVPRHAGVLSAIGIATAPEVVERGQGLLLPLDEDATEAVRTTAATLEEQAVAGLQTAGGTLTELAWAADVRYRGQAHELRVAIEKPEPATIVQALHAAHEREYGFATRERPAELVALRCRAQGVPRDLPGTAIEAAGGTGEREPIALAGGVPAVQVSRADLAVGSTLDGPAVVTQPDATTFIPQGWRATVDAGGNLEVIPA